MLKRTNTAIVMGLMIILTVCGCTKKGSNRASSSRTYSAERTKARQRDTMVRHVNAIISDISHVRQRLSEERSSIEADRKALEQARSNARKSYEGGQMRDFKVWQRIGREKQQNILATTAKVERTFDILRQDTETKLRRVNWISDQDHNRYREDVSRRLTELETLASSLSTAYASVSNQKWLEYTE